MRLLAHTAYRNGNLRVGGEVIAVPAGELDSDLANAWQALGVEYPRFHRADRLSRLTMLGATPFLQEGGILAGVDKEHIGLVLMTNTGSMDGDTRYNDQLRADGIASPALFVPTLPNIALGELTIQHKLYGAGLCLAMARPQLNALRIAIDVLRAQGMHHFICGWADIFAAHANATFLAIDATDDGLEDINTYQALFDTP